MTRKNLRKSLLLKSKHKCWYCGTKLTLASMTIDHFYPKARGGSNDINNLVPSCTRCNNLKGSDPSLRTLRYKLSIKNKNMYAIYCTMRTHQVPITTARRLVSEDQWFWFEENILKQKGRSTKKGYIALEKDES